MDDLILSDVHLHGRNSGSASCTVINGDKLGRNEVYVSAFRMKCPGKLKSDLRQRTAMVENSFNHEPDMVPCVDEDGDMVVTRNTNNGYFNRDYIVLYIHHSMACTLNAVGLQVWQGALLMNDYILSNIDIFLGKKILELGGGVGLTSLVSGMIAESVVCTDLEGSILRLCEKNLSLNSVLLQDKTKFSIVELDWTHDEDSIKKLGLVRPDIILACDVVYDNDITDAFFRTLHRLLSKHLYVNLDIDNKAPITVFISTEKRLNFTLAELDITCKEHDHFRKCLAELEIELAPSLMVEKIDVPHITQYCEYDRVPQLAIWKLTFQD